jgi:Cu/Ag efflux protein CusF
MDCRALLIVTAFVAAAFPATVLPQTNVEAMKTPGTASFRGTVTVTAMVVGIDASSRTVSLKEQNGKVVHVVVGEEARNFDQLRVGDIVTVQYREALTLSLKKGGGLRSIQEHQTTERAAAGEKPGGTIGREVTIMADVVAIDKKAKTVTLKGPQGNTVDLVVDDPKRLSEIRKGDQVEATYLESVAISVEAGLEK